MLACYASIVPAFLTGLCILGACVVNYIPKPGAYTSHKPKQTFVAWPTNESSKDQATKACLGLGRQLPLHFAVSTKP
jgi:hypothetical protein